VKSAFSSFESNFDSHYGGFGEAPKFPRTSALDFLLQYYKESGNKKALHMVLLTLQKMAEGGIHDQIGGGFHRYSVDPQWRIPHFEKMLYDQALLTNTYLEAYKITEDAQYAHTARDILSFVNHTFSHPWGGFYSALDAESSPPGHPAAEKEEGAYYLWTKTQIDNALNPKQAHLFEYVYGIKKEGNALEDSQGDFGNKNILYRAHAIGEAARNFDLDVKQASNLLSAAQQTLQNIRNKRPRPFLDDKIILSWNGLMISAYANAGRILGDQQYLDEAIQSTRFLLKKLYNPDTGVLKRTYRNKEAQNEAGLEDYAYFVKGLIALYRATHQKRWLSYVKTFTNIEIRKFYDRDHGGFFDTSNDDQLLFRTKDYYDGARPSGNSVTITNLAELSRITGNSTYHELALRSLRFFGKYLNNRPAAMPQMLLGLEYILHSQPK